MSGLSLDLDEGQGGALFTIKISEGKGRGLFACRHIPARTVIEISPVLLFSAEEYREHGRHTILDNYTFKWPDGRMALALGSGSLFNHSDSPNVSFSVETAGEIIRFTTARPVDAGEELCIFYGHSLWFTDVDKRSGPKNELAVDVLDDWDVLCSVMNEGNTYLEGNSAEVVPEGDLPFLRTKVTADVEDGDEEGSVRTIKAWVVDVPDPKQTSILLKWVRDGGLETPDLLHLKRVRRSSTGSSLLLSATEAAPSIPRGFALSEPYQVDVPESVALTPKSLKLKLQIWPTVYAPRRKYEPEPWTRAKSAWAWEAMEVLKDEARKAVENGGLPIVSYVPRPFTEETGTASGTADMPYLLAYDTRDCTSNPLRHSVLNVIRKVADWRASHTTSTSPTPPAEVSSSDKDDDPTSSGLVPPTTDSDGLADGIPRANGTHYLLTGLTLFTTHEPCIMCSMALLHSRVREVVFARSMDATGGCGGSDGRGTCVPRLRGVNHRYSILRWNTWREQEVYKDDWAAIWEMSEDVDA